MKTESNIVNAINNNTKSLLLNDATINLQNSFDYGGSYNAINDGGVYGLSRIIKQNIMLNSEIPIFYYHNKVFVAWIIFWFSPSLIPAKSTPVIANATIEPMGIARPVIAVAIALSLSPNHLLHKIFYALRKIGPARDMIDVPPKMGQNESPTSVNMRIQPPKVRKKHPNLRTLAVE